LEQITKTAAQAWQPLIEPGMVVAGVAGDAVGHVQEVREFDFLVDRSGGLGMQPESALYVRYEHVHVLLGDKITLDIPSSQLDARAATDATIPAWA
jgi:hypothetical protein